MKSYISLFLFIVAFLPVVNGQVENASFPGEISTPYPTITCLAAEWEIIGDDDQEIGRASWRERV